MVLQCLRLRIMADSERVNWSAERVPGQPTDRATSSSSSTGTLGIVARTIKAPSSQPPTPRMIGYADRSTALALPPKRPRLCTHQAIQTRESTVTAGSASASATKTFDIAEGPRWREVDGLGVVERVIDLAASKKVLISRLLASGFTAKKVAVWRDAGQDDLLDVRQVGEEFLHGDLRQDESAVRDLGVRLPQ